MSFINTLTREINCKVVYYGPGLCGKTTNLQHIYETTNPESRGKMISLATEAERTLFFDFLPLAVGEIRGFNTRFHLYTGPGHVLYNTSRKIILRGVDGIVFVADSAPNRLRANAESLRNLRENLAEHNLDLKDIPHVVQINKRDLPEALPVDMIRMVLDPQGQVPVFEAVASRFEGVFEPLRAVSAMVLEKLAQRT